MRSSQLTHASSCTCIMCLRVHLPPRASKWLRTAGAGPPLSANQQPLQPPSLAQLRRSGLWRCAA
eukprot:8053-Heterococcus_DN1.PRE.1